MMRVELEAAYILHSRPYRENSRLVYALTEQYGVVHMISRGSNKKGNNNLQPFMKLHLSWSGSSDLMSLNKVEYDSSSYTSNFRAQVQCFYMHELIIKLIPVMSPAPELFSLYESSIKEMTQNPHDEAVLRRFELQLLAIMGHPLQLKFDYINDEQIVDDGIYRYDPDLGPTRVNESGSRWNMVTGLLLNQLDIQHLTIQNQSQAKIFLRGLMQHYLQGKPLMTRRLLKVN